MNFVSSIDGPGVSNEIAVATQALVRGVSQSYAIYDKPGRPVSIELAVRQHAAYISALQKSGLEISFVEPDESRPDCVFIEDTAVVWNQHALITRMCPDREGEQQAVQNILQKTHEIRKLTGSATLEGGDVLHTADTTYVGLSSRTNKPGVRDLRNFMAIFGRRVISIPIEKCLHLKTCATYLGDGQLMVAPGLIPTNAFDAEAMIETDPSEARAANCLRIGRHLLIPAGCPKTERRLQRFAETKNLEIISLNISEFEKGDGSLTCLSIIW